MSESLQALRVHGVPHERVNVRASTDGVGARSFGMQLTFQISHSLAGAAKNLKACFFLALRECDVCGLRDHSMSDQSVQLLRRNRLRGTARRANHDQDVLEAPGSGRFASNLPGHISILDTSRGANKRFFAVLKLLQR